MPKLSDRLVVVAITQHQARVWLSGIDLESIPTKIDAPDPKARHHHVREAQHHGGHDVDHSDASYFEEIAKSVASAKQILIVGHGKGKADSAAEFMQHLKRKHPETASKVSGSLEANLPAMSEPEILGLARHWFEQHIKTGL